MNRKTITTIGVFHNHLGAAAVVAVKQHLPSVFHKKRLQTVEAQAEYISMLFLSDDDHPIIWREYAEGDIQNHAEIGGYKTVCRISAQHLNSFKCYI